MFLTQVDSPLVIVALFKASSAGRLMASHDDEIRRRCRHCGWVNVFHPEHAKTRASGMLEFKKLNGSTA